MIKVDEGLKAILPPLRKDEYDRLEKSILKNGVRDPIEIWAGHDVIIDGHNRYEICKKHDIRFSVIEKTFETIEDVKIYMLEKQLERRNLSDMQRIATIHALDEIIAQVKAAAEKKHSANGGDHGNQYTGGKVAAVEKFPPPPNRRSLEKSRDVLGEMAGVSGKTYEHGVYALEHAPKPVIEAANNDDLSINAAFNISKMQPEEQAEVVERINSGEKAKDVYRDVRKREKELKAQREQESINHDLEEEEIQHNLDELEQIIEDDEDDDFEPYSEPNEGQAILWDSQYENSVVACDLLITEAPEETDWLYSALSGVRCTGFAYVVIDNDPSVIKRYLESEIPVNVELFQILTWHFTYLMANRDVRGYKPTSKMILFYRGIDAGSPHYVTASDRDSVITIDGEGGNLSDYVYEIQFPVALAEKLVRHGSSEGDLVFDPFAKRGAVLIAAKKLGRDAVGYRTDESDDDEMRDKGIDVTE